LLASALFDNQFPYGVRDMAASNCYTSTNKRQQTNLLACEPQNRIALRVTN